MNWKRLALTVGKVALSRFGLDPQLFLGEVAEEEGISKDEFFAELRAEDEQATKRLLSARERRKRAVEKAKEGPGL